MVAADGTLYAANEDGQVFALDPEGQLVWTFDPGTGRPVDGDMALGADGTLYVGIGAIVHAILPNGNEFWSKEMDNTVKGLAIGIDGNIYVSNGSSTFVALDPSGNEQWTFNPGRGVDYPATVAADGTVYFGTPDKNHDNFFALDPDGSLKWSANIGDNRNSPALAPDGSVYLPIEVAFTPQGFLVKLDPDDGSEIWRHEVDGSVTTSPAVGADGVVYLGTDSEKLFAVNADGSERWTFDLGHDTVCSPAIAPDGSLYIGSRESLLYAVRTTSHGLAASAWPKKRQGDVRNTGQAGSDVSRGRWFAPHVFWLDEQNQAVITARHIGGSTGSSAGAPASFRVHLLNRDGSEAYTLDETINPGESKDVQIAPPGGGTFIGSAVVDAPAVDTSFLAFFLTWNIEVSAGNAFRVGAFFSRPDEAALIHHFPAESSARNGLGIAMQNIGDNQISCTLEFFTPAGALQSQETLEMEPLGSVVQFFDDRLPDNFNGGATLACDAPVVAVAVTQDLDNGFPTDRLTAKGGSQ